MARVDTETVASIHTLCPKGHFLIGTACWVHVSDFHFGSRDGTFSEDVACQALLDDVKMRIRDETPAFVLVSGDIAFSGLADEYAKAGEFLSKLADAVGVEKKRFFFVPGNHDVDRSRQSLAFRGAQTLLVSESEVDRVIGSMQLLGELTPRQAAFWEFVEDFTGGQEKTFTSDGLGYVAPLDLGGLNLCILGVNSAWMSGENGEEMKLLIGERQVIELLAIAQTHEPQLQIAIAHHPVEWLYEWDQTAIRQRLLKAVHMYHRGHLHQPDVSLTASPGRPCLSVAAGSAHASRFYDNSYNVVKVDLGAASCEVRPFRYDAQTGEYKPDAITNADIVPDGELPASLSDLASALKAAVPKCEQFSRYLAALLIKQKDEVPVRIENAVEFVTSAVAESLGPESPTVEFLRLRNMLRLYRAEVPVEARIADHREPVERFCDFLAELAQADEACRLRIANDDVDLGVVSDASKGTQEFTIAFLEELRAAGDWSALESQAVRFVHSAQETLAKTARAFFVEALIHSDEGQKRAEAVARADELTANSTSVGDFLLAAAAREVVGDDDGAVRVTLTAIDTCAPNEQLLSYARQLSLRTGNSALREAIKAYEGQGSNE